MALRVAAGSRSNLRMRSPRPAYARWYMQKRGTFSDSSRASTPGSSSTFFPGRGNRMPTFTPGSGQRRRARRGAQAGGVIDEAKALLGGQLAREIAVFRLRIAVHAVQVAAAGGVPDHDRLLVRRVVDQVWRESRRGASV